MSCQGGLLGVQDSPFFAVRVLHSVVNADIPQVQAVLQNLVGIGAAGSVGGVGRYIFFGYGAFARDLPLGSIGGIIDLDSALKVIRGIEGLIHELLNVLLVNPGSTQAHLDLRSVQVFRLGIGQGLYIDGKGWVLLCGPLCLPQFATHIAGQIFVSGHIGWPFSLRHRPRQTEDYTLQLGGQLVAGFAGELFHVLHVHTGFL